MGAERFYGFTGHQEAVSVQLLRLKPGLTPMAVNKVPRSSPEAYIIMRPTTTAVKTAPAFFNLVGSPPAVIKRNPPKTIRMVATMGTIPAPNGGGKRKKFIMFPPSTKMWHSPQADCFVPSGLIPPQGISPASATDGKRASAKNAIAKRGNSFFIVVIVQYIMLGAFARIRTRNTTSEALRDIRFTTKAL